MTDKATPKNHAVNRSFYQALDYFFYVVENGSVGHASTALGVNEVTIAKNIRTCLTSSNQLKELYTHIQYPKASLQLTSQGEIFYKYSRELVDLKNRLNHEVSRYDHYKNSRTFTIACTPFYSVSFIPDLVSRLKQTAPNSRVRTIIVSESDSIDNINTNDGPLTNLLVENKVDLFLGTDYKYHRHYSRKEIGTEKWKLIYHAVDIEKLYSQNNSEYQNDLPITDIDDNTLLSTLDFAFCDYVKLKSYLEQKCPHINVTAEVSDYSSLIATLRKMGTFSIVPETVAIYAHELTSGELLYTDLPSSISPPGYVLCGYFSSYNVHSDAGHYLHDELRNLTEDYYSNILV